MGARARGINSIRQGLGAWTPGALPCSPCLQVGPAIRDPRRTRTQISFARAAQAPVEERNLSCGRRTSRHDGEGDGPE
jgi:hypothetical protein